jgi:hypothetical protein
MYKERIIKYIVLMSMATLIFTLFLSSCSAGVRALTEKNNGDSININISDNVEIKLESNPTTGYSWFLSDKVDKTIVSVTDPVFIESKKMRNLWEQEVMKYLLLKVSPKERQVLH